MKRVANFICGVTGKPGSGKSTILRYLIDREHKKGIRGGIVIVDLKGEYLDLIGTYKETYKRLKYLKISDEMWRQKLFDFAGFLNYHKYVLISPQKLPADIFKDIVDEVAIGVLKVEDRALFLDEAHFGSPIYSPLTTGLSTLTTLGRSDRIDFYYATVRPSSINTTLVSEANIRICLALDDKNDIERVSNWFNKEDILNLKVFDFLAKNTFTGRVVRGNTANLSTLDEIFKE